MAINNTLIEQLLHFSYRHSCGSKREVDMMYERHSNIDINNRMTAVKLASDGQHIDGRIATMH